MSMKTQTIAGHEITLEEGRRYFASRRWIDDKHIHNDNTEYPVSIKAQSGAGHFETKPTLVIRKLNFDAANELLTAFNNEKVSLTGRVW